MNITTLLSMVGRIDPRAYDAIIPHGPAQRFRHQIDAVALNPQPLPPAEVLQLGAARMAHDVMRLAVEQEATGTFDGQWLLELVDDWCGTPWPRKWPWPGAGPRPGEGPQPDPWDVQQARLVGAIVFSSVADRLGDTELSGVLHKSVQRLAETALAG